MLLYSYICLDEYDTPYHSVKRTGINIYTQTNPPDTRRKEKVGALYNAVSGLLAMISRV